MHWLVVLLATVLAVSAVPQPQPPTDRIVGGSLTTIDQYPFQAVVLVTWGSNLFELHCGATILNTRSLLTAAHCFWSVIDPNRFRVRVGSSYAHSGGVVHIVSLNTLHPEHGRLTLFDSDVAIIRLLTTITFNALVQPGRIAGSNYNVADNQPVWAVGWGRQWSGGPLSEQLRHVQVWTVNQAICNQRYGGSITNSMLCSGWLDVGGRDQCQGDSGGPLLHNGNVVGVCSWGSGCADPRYPGVNARVSFLSNWIVANA